MAEAVDFARKKAELLNAAQQDGREVTPELTAEIDALAEAYARAGKEAEEVEDRLKKMEESAEGARKHFADMFTAILDGSMSASDALRNLTSRLLAVASERAFMELFPMAAATAFGPLSAVRLALLAATRAMAASISLPVWSIRASM